MFLNPKDDKMASLTDKPPKYVVWGVIALAAYGALKFLKIIR